MTLGEEHWAEGIAEQVPGRAGHVPGAGVGVGVEVGVEVWGYRGCRTIGVRQNRRAPGEVNGACRLGRTW